MTDLRTRAQYRAWAITAQVFAALITIVSWGIGIQGFVLLALWGLGLALSLAVPASLFGFRWACADCEHVLTTLDAGCPRCWRAKDESPSTAVTTTGVALSPQAR